METYTYEGDLHKLRKWAVNRRNDEAPPEPYRSWVRGLMPENCRGAIGYWVGVITPESSVLNGWVRGYPHAHVESVNWHPETTTAVTYLSVADSGGEFGIGGTSEDDPYEFINPVPGLTVLMDAVTWHGVKPVHAGTRMALITSGPPAIRMDHLTLSGESRAQSEREP